MPTTPEISIPQCKEILSAPNAIFYDGLENTSTLLNKDREIHVGWKEATLDYYPQLDEFLRNYTWATNTVAQKWVKDPVIQGQKYEGTWRQVTVQSLKRYNGQTQQEEFWIILTLRKGWITSLVTAGTLDWSEARLVDAKQLPAGTSTVNPGGNEEEVYTIARWMNVSPDNVETIKASINALDVNAFAPTISGVSYGSGWHRLYTASGIENDGSATISIILAKPEFTLESFSSWNTTQQNNVTYHWNVPKNLAQALITAEQSRGRTAACSYNETQGLVDIVVYTKTFNVGRLNGAMLSVNCDAVMYGDFYWGVYDQSAYITPSAQGWTYFKDISLNTDGAYDIIIRGRKTMYRDYPERVSESSIMLTRKERLMLGVTTETVPNVDASVQGYVYRQRRDPNDDCSSNWLTVSDQGIYAYVPWKQILDASASHAFERQFRNNTVPVDASESAQGILYQARNTLNEFGLYDSEEQARISKNIEAYFGFYPSRYARRFTRRLRNRFDIYSDINVLPMTGLNAVSVAIEDDGTYSGEIESMTGVYADVPQKNVTSSMVADVYERSAKNSTDTIESVSASQGSIYQTRNTLNEFGLYDIDERMVKTKPIDLYTTFNARVGQGWLYRFRNVPSVGAYVAMLPVNQSNAISIQIEDDGTYSGEVQYQPSGNTGSVFVGESAKWIHIERHFRDNPENKTQSQYRDVYWPFYSGYKALRQDAADMIQNKQRTDLSAYRDLWYYLYALPPVIHIDWAAVVVTP